jgi:hypothetical protein
MQSVRYGKIGLDVRLESRCSSVLHAGALGPEVRRALPYGMQSGSVVLAAIPARWPSGRLSGASLGPALRRSILAAIVLAALVGCKQSDHPPIYHRDLSSSAVDGGIDAGDEIPIEASDASAPPEDTTGLCGNTILPLQLTRPNVYFAIDRSGSMADRSSGMQNPETGLAISNYDAAWLSIHDVLFALGHRVSYGAAVFPRFGNVDQCDAGAEVYPVTAGDSVTYARNGIDGPNLTKLISTLSKWAPEGATPMSATLGKLVSPLTALGGATAVVLATDGAPNCNPVAVCDQSQCIPNIDSAPLPDGSFCSVNGGNCCAAAAYYGPENCIDADASVAPIAELLNSGIKTYVIGLPGSEAFQSLLGRLAVAGGTARVQSALTDPLYYLVSDTSELTAALKGITADLAISCTVTLDAVPPDWTQVNVYFDNSLVKPADGWKQTDERTLEITGPSCTLLRSGDVFQIQVVSGCPTAELI